MQAIASSRSISNRSAGSSSSRPNFVACAKAARLSKRCPILRLKRVARASRSMIEQPLARLAIRPADLISLLAEGEAAKVADTAKTMTAAAAMAAIPAAKRFRWHHRHALSTPLIGRERMGRLSRYLRSSSPSSAAREPALRIFGQRFQHKRLQIPRNPTIMPPHRHGSLVRNLFDQFDLIPLGKCRL